jgi:hypothetical protein
MILHSSGDSEPIQLLPRYIKNVKQISHSPDEFALDMMDKEAFCSLRNPKSEFNYKSIIHTPNLLIQAFLYP